ncbi:hypothetical protein [Dactylosporangium darangshiense]|uniref:Uncharacterized protein n=1 Tax=Dactylosporangium darangshiense TaxID=579108 RepID=A0ABP8DDJ6_9ACTN
MDQDLHTLLTSVRDDAPPPRLSVDDITAAGRHLARRRRRLTLLSSVGGGALAAVAALAAAFVLAASPTAPQTPAVDPSTLPNIAASPAPTAFGEAPPFVTTYRGYEAGSYVVSDPDLVTTAYQQSSIEATFDPSGATPEPSLTTDPLTRARAPELVAGGTLVVYRSGVFDPVVFAKGGDKIEMRSGVGLLHYAGGMSGPVLSATDQARLEKFADNVPALAWQYTTDSWAAIYWSSWQTVPDRDHLIAIAEGLTPAAPKAFPVGFQPGYLPRGYVLMSVSYGTDMGYGNRVVSAARLTPKPPALPLTEPINFDEWPSLTLSFGHMDANPKMAQKYDCAGNTTCTRVLDDGATYVRVDVNGLKITQAMQLTQIAVAMKPQDPDDMAAWPAAVKTFP